MKDTETISQHLFGKPVDEIKYLMLTNFIHQPLLDEDLTRSGLYQWINVFKGDIKRPQDVTDYNDYDIIQINLSVQDYHLINNVREKLGKDSKTKIVANNDYTVELWQSSFDFLDTMRRELGGADMIFGTEHHMSNALEVLTDRKIHTSPHPSHIKRLKSLSPKKKTNALGVLWHRYDKLSLVPGITVKGLDKETWLIGYDQKQDNKPYTTALYYDKVFQGGNFQDFCEQLMSVDMIFEPFSLTSHGRTTIETAAFGIPTIGSNRVESVRRCFPYTAVDTFDVKEARAMIKKVMTDEHFREKVISYAREAVEYYNHQTSAARYLQFLYEGSKKIE